MSNIHPPLSTLSPYALLDRHPVPVWILASGSLQVLYANPAACDLYGYSATTFRQLFFTDLFPEACRPIFPQVLERSAAAGLGHFRQLTADGTPVTVALFATAMEEEEAWQITAMDVSSCHDQKLQLEEERERYQVFMEQSSLGIYRQELPVPVSVNEQEDVVLERLLQARIAECNGAMAGMYGFESTSALLGKPAIELFDLSNPANLDFLRQFIRNGFRVHNGQSHEKDCNGRSVHFLNSAVGIIEDGCLVRVWGWQTDITDIKAIEERNTVLANLVEETSGVLTTADAEFRPLTWNRAAEKVYGLKEEQVIGRNLRELLTIEYKDATQQEVRQLIESRGEWRGEMSFVRPTDGRTITLLTTFKQLHSNNNFIGYIISGADITEQVERESRLQESENRFRELADHTPVMIWMTDEKGLTTYLNRSWLHFTGEDISGKSGAAWAALVHPEDREEAIRQYRLSYDRREGLSLVYRLRTAGGRYRWVKDVSAPRFLGNGTFLGYIGSVVDIDEQKHIEEQLRYQATMLENVSDIVVSTDSDFRVVAWNKAAEKYYHIPSSEATGRKMGDLIHFQFQGTTREEALNALLEEGFWSGEVSLENEDGPLYFLQSVKQLHNAEGRGIGYLAIGRDITERKRIEARLAESEQFYRTLIADSLDTTLLLDEEGKITYSSPAVRHILGYEVDEVIGRNAFEFVHTDDLVRAFESFQREIVENPEVKFVIIRVRKKSGEWIWCMARGHNLLGNPSIRSIVVYLHDDTLRKRASEALKESESRFRSLIRDLQVGVFLCDAGGQITTCNEALAAMVGIGEEAILGRSVYEIMSDKMIDERGLPIPRQLRPLTKALQLRQSVKGAVVGVSHPVTGSRAWIMVNADPVLDEKDQLKHVVCSVMDITERKKLEKQLLAEQMAHQKQLTQATIDGQEKERQEIGKELHDNFGQQLTTIKLFLDLARSQAGEGAQEMLSMALKGILDVINAIRSMSRSLVPHTLTDLGLTESVAELADSLERTQLLRIQLDAGGFDEEVLAANQRLALFRIIQEQLNNITRHAEARQAWIILRTTVREVVLTIRDDGKGFDTNTLRKGLGFTNISNRAGLFNGSVEISSGEGQGCTVRVSLPLHSEASASLN
jgi:PAS domain S-box-containing protein